MKISAIITSRNDNNKINYRLLLTLKNLIKTYEEIIYVDYGSPEIPLHEFMEKEIPKSGKLRCITVTQDQINELYPEDKNKFIEVYGRNIGIRRATNDFIVSTNQDIICDKPNELEMDTLYTVARYNFPKQLFNNIITNDNLLDDLKNSKNFLQKQPDSVDINGNPTWDPGDKWSLVVGCGDYQIAHKNIWNKIRGFEESMIHRSYADSNLMKKASKFFNIKKLNLDIFHLDHDVNMSSNYQNNDRIKYVNNFDETTNKETWGFSDMIFKEIVL